MTHLFSSYVSLNQCVMSQVWMSHTTQHTRVRAHHARQRNEGVMSPWCLSDFSRINVSRLAVPSGASTPRSAKSKGGELTSRSLNKDLSLFSARSKLSQRCVAVCCGVLQCDAVWCTVFHCAALRCSVVQCVAMRCSVVQCGAVRCSVTQCVAVCRSALQCIAM